MTREGDRLHPDLEALPAGVFALPAGAEDLRALVLRRSEGVLRRRRAGRRLLQVAAFAALYALGFLSARLVDVESPKAQLVAEPAPGPVAEPVAERVAEPGGAPAAPDDGQTSDPLLLEQLARSGSRHRRGQHLRRAGDLYLVEYGDVAAATRCYANYLALTPADRRSADDTWLLAALKNDSD